MNNFLDDFSTFVSVENSQFVVTYVKDNFSGTTKYVEYPKPKYQLTPVLLMVESDMGDVIEYGHKLSPMSSDKLNEVNMYIRNHSLNILQQTLFK